MVFFKFRTVSIAIAVLLLAITTALPQNNIVLAKHQSTYRIAAEKSGYQGDVYLVRGFANVFSRGLDRLGVIFNSRGIAAKVIPHTAWRAAAVKIYGNQKKYGPVPVVLIGHSLGANATIRIAEFLKKRNVKVQYLVTFEPTIRLDVPSNVRVAVNYFLSNSIMGESLKREPRSGGSFRNIDMVKVDGIGHFNIEENTRLQRTVLRNVLRYIQPARRPR